MKVPLSWLKEYVDLQGSADEVASALVMAGVGVESVQEDVLDLEITANRADLLSMIGVAREVGVLRRIAPRVPSVRLPEGGTPVSESFSVEVRDPALCPRYTARAVTGLRIGPSPAWMAGRLAAAGIRSINNVVDATNYVLLETGQPLHAFDAKGLRGGKIVVRRAATGETIAAIDGKEYSLSTEMLVIADAERPVAIAGVMGGRESEIGPGTTDVLLESAQFDPVAIRRASRRLGLSSESSYRFERGVDYETVDGASRRALQLILELAGGTAMSGVIDAGSPPPPRSAVRVRAGRVSRVLGLDVPPERTREILMGLGCSVSGAGDEMRVMSPPGRRDLKIEADYIEEVARIEGYDRIPCDTRFGLRVAEVNSEDLVREEVRSVLTGLGGFEVLTWSFAEAGAPNRVPFWTDQALIPLRDPQGRVDRTLRESLVPGLLKVLQTNEAYKEVLRPVFEVAQIYVGEGKEYRDRTMVGVAAPGDPLAVKGLVETLLDRLQVKAEIRPATGAAFLVEGSAAEIFLRDKRIGYLGAPVAGLAGLREPVGVAEIDFKPLVDRCSLARTYREIPRQPPVARDLAVVLAEGVSWAQVEAAVRSAAPETLERIRFQTEYRGKGIEEGRKSVAFSMLFRTPDRTLTGEEAEESIRKILKVLEDRLGARLRGA